MATRTKLGHAASQQPKTPRCLGCVTFAASRLLPLLLTVVAETADIRVIFPLPGVQTPHWKKPRAVTDTSRWKGFPSRCASGAVEVNTKPPGGVCGGP